MRVCMRVYIGCMSLTRELVIVFTDHYSIHQLLLKFA